MARELNARELLSAPYAMRIPPVDPEQPEDLARIGNDLLAAAQVADHRRNQRVKRRLSGLN